MLQIAMVVRPEIWEARICAYLLYFLCQISIRMILFLEDANPVGRPNPPLEILTRMDLAIQFDELSIQKSIYHLTKIAKGVGLSHATTIERYHRY